MAKPNEPTSRLGGWEGYEEDFVKGNYPGKAVFYILKGTDFVNFFKYVGAGIVVLYVALKLTDVWSFIGMVLISLPILFVIGWIYIHKLARVLDYLTTQHGTFWSRYQFSLLERQIELLKELVNKKSSE